MGPFTGREKQSLFFRTFSSSLGFRLIPRLIPFLGEPWSRHDFVEPFVASHDLAMPGGGRLSAYHRLLLYSTLIILSRVVDKEVRLREISLRSDLGHTITAMRPLLGFARLLLHYTGCGHKISF